MRTPHALRGTPNHLALSGSCLAYSTQAIAHTCGGRGVCLPHHKYQLSPVSNRHAVLEAAQVLLVH